MMIDNEQLKERIDWPGVLAQPRYAGGHEEVLRNVFGSQSDVIAWWHEGDYQGAVAIAHRIPSGEIILMTDYYGSCSGCDAWESSSESDARKMISDIVQHAKIFSSVSEALTWLQTSDPKTCPWKYPFEPAKNLIPQLEKLSQ